MSMFEILRRSGGLEMIARDIGLSTADSSRGAAALLPAVIEGFQKCDQRLTDQGGIIALIDSHGGYALASNVMAEDQTETDRGNTLLAEIFGDKEISRIVAANAAERTGLDVSDMKRILPSLAMLVGGYLSARVASSGPNGEQELRQLLRQSDARRNNASQLYS